MRNGLLILFKSWKVWRAIFHGVLSDIFFFFFFHKINIPLACITNVFKHYQENICYIMKRMIFFQILLAAFDVPSGKSSERLDERTSRDWISFSYLGQRAIDVEGEGKGIYSMAQTREDWALADKRFRILEGAGSVYLSRTVMDLTSDFDRCHLSTSSAPIAGKIRDIRGYSEKKWNIATIFATVKSSINIYQIYYFSLSHRKTF